MRTLKIEITKKKSITLTDNGSSIIKFNLKLVISQDYW